MSDAFAVADLTRTAAFAAGLAALWVVAGWAGGRGFGREGDVRKVNHVAAFVGAVAVFGWLPEPTARVSLYVGGAAVMLAVAAACRFRDRPPFCHAFAANARPSDFPHEAFFFWSSWLVGLAALAAVDLAFRSMAVTRAAALIVGLADGIAEPVGRRCGRHRYRVPARRGPATYRSAEGSAAAFAAALAVVLACTAPGPAGPAAWALAATATALATTAVEALSPRGTDNFTIALAAAALLHAFLAAGWMT